MSSNRNDKPAAGFKPDATYDRGQGDRIKPDRGEVFVRTAGGTTLLTQTLNLFRRNPRS